MLVAGKKTPVKTPGKLMRLRCRLRPLFEGYLMNDQISEKDCDVTFECQGGQARGHKIILSIVSKFFCQVFADQKPYKPTTVYVPDVPVNIMKLILKLCYKDNIKLTMKTMRDLGNYLSMFGLAWDQFNFTEADSEEKGTPRVTMTSQNRQGTPRQVLPASSLGVKKPVVYTNVGGKLVSTGNVVATESTVLKSPSQTFVLDPKSVSNGGEESTGDFKFKIQNYKVQKELPKTHPRLILPKPPGFSHPATPAKLKVGPPVLKRMPQANAHMNTMTSDGIEVEMDDARDNDDAADGPESEHLFHEWMASVGKVSTSPPRLTKPSPIKRKASPVAAAVATSSKGGLDKASKRQCSVCSWVFDEDSKWRWHEERHVGINLFKCTLCEQLFSTARQVYQHEMMEHGIIGTCDEKPKSDNRNETQGFIGHMPVGEGNPRRIVIKSQYGTQYRRVVPLSPKRSKVSPVKTYKGNYAHLHYNFASRNSLIGIGEHEGQHLIESRKLKQLHWLYVCSKCENCSDSSSKAISHYKLCFPEKDPKFEDTVVKFRQGFYGKCKCPLCPRRYTSLGGFLIHCGHMHQEYRRVFSHINSEDKMMCVNCRDKFSDPAAFHGHLNEDMTCTRPPKEDLEQQDSPLGNSELIRQRQFTKLIGKNPRSARLQNRLAAVTACFEDDPIDEESFGEVTCPICGEAAVTNFTEHILSSHQELDIQVERVEESTLRCKACGITFAICDLLTHNNSCTGSKGLNYVAQRKTAQISTPKSAPKPKMNISYPPGIGTSSVEKMDKEDLLSLEVLREALTCGVCKRVGKKMNIIAECLRSHGVYRCAICFNSFLSKEQNSLHLKKCHANNAGRVICPICRIVRSNAGQLTSHMYNTHWLPVLQENAVDIRANKLLNQMQETDTSVNETDKDESLNSTAESSAVEPEAEDTEESSSLGLKELFSSSEPAAEEGTAGVENSSEVRVSTVVTETNEVEVPQ
ncbi:unnamed protein product [Allacma fusca]|uniref:Uncharacterized protein n=1 Tax=Allacma fusca TaxID=39272 RepID=A0A8J2NW00_9HEXA|nr:unnamed protein product [Allacma fusca]